jgi:hypothetical protein
MTGDVSAPQPQPQPPVPPRTYTGSPINRGIGRPVRPRRYGGRRGLITFAVVVVTLGAFGWVGLHDNADAKRAPVVGSCVRVEGSGSDPKLHQVDCSDSTAEYTVLAKFVGGDAASCRAVSGSTADFGATEVDPALHTQHPAYVLCLGPN